MEEQGLWKDAVGVPRKLTTGTTDLRPPACGRAGPVEEHGWRSTVIDGGHGRPAALRVTVIVPQCHEKCPEKAPTTIFPVDNFPFRASRNAPSLTSNAPPSAVLRGNCMLCEAPRPRPKKSWHEFQKHARDDEASLKALLR